MRGLGHENLLKGAPSVRLKCKPTLKVSLMLGYSMIFLTF